MDMEKLKEDTMQALDEMIDLAEQFYANEKESLAHKRNDEYLEIVEQMISDAKKQREIIAALRAEKPAEDDDKEFEGI